MLASRGIPTLILEDHLRALARALAKEYPDSHELSTRFDEFLGRQQSERRAVQGFDALRQLIREFDVRLGACAEPRIASAAQLIASAWIDERCGIGGALASVAPYFADAARFSDEWSAHVQELVRQLESIPSPC